VGVAVTKSALSPARQRLVEMMQDLNFGRIEGLVVRGGEPVFDQPPWVVREVKLGGENSPRPEAAKADFVLKAQVRELFAQMNAMREGIVATIEVKHGLPFKMTIEEVPA